MERNWRAGRVDSVVGEHRWKSPRFSLKSRQVSLMLIEARDGWIFITQLPHNRSITVRVKEDQNMRKTKLAAFAAVVAAGTLIATNATAAPGDLGVGAGTLDFDPAGAPAVGTFAGITLNGQPQLTRADLAPFTIIDARGTGAGWTVNGASTIAATNLSMTAATVIDSSTGIAAVTVTGTAVPSFTSGVATPIVTGTAALTSSGTFLVSPKIIKLVVPATALVGTYATTATLTVA
jgi:hypothetical protein